jgi:hypothetical protein
MRKCTAISVRTIIFISCLLASIVVGAERRDLRDMGPVSAGGFYLEHGLPDPYAYYAFGDGDLSLTVERWGGINSIFAIDVFSKDGKLYPDRCFTSPLLWKEAGRCGKRELYGPGLQFISTHTLPDGRKGRNLFHFPEKMAEREETFSTSPKKWNSTPSDSEVPQNSLATTSATISASITGRFSSG